MRALLESYSSVCPLSGRRHSNIVGIIHFAAYKAVEESIRKPLSYYRNNISGLIDFMTLLEESAIKTFIFSSSAAVYGTLADGSRPLREGLCVHQAETYKQADGSEYRTQPGYTGITSPYGRTKYFGEAIQSDLATSDPTCNIVGLRYFNPIGCDASGLLGENPQGVPSNLLPVVVKVVAGQYTELSGYGNDWDTADGTAIRDFIHVSDLARGHIAVLFAAESGPIQGGYRTFSIGTGSGHPVLEVVTAMEGVSQCQIPTKMISRRAGDVQASVAVVDRARDELHWQTQESLTCACREIWNQRLIGVYESVFNQRRA